VEIITVKNVLMPTQYKSLIKLIDDGGFTWHYKNHIHLVQDEYTTKTSDSHGLITMFYNEDQVRSPHYDAVLPVLFNMVDLLNGNLTKLHRIHAALTINVNKDHNFYPHTDYFPPKMSDNWYTAVYYLGESDGDTVFFEDDETTIKHTQKFEPNSASVFSGSIKHSGSLPRMHPKRIVLNFNFDMERAG